MLKRIVIASVILTPRLLAFQTGPVPPPPAAEPVSLTQIAARDEELRKVLRDISNRLPMPSELEDFEQQLAQREEVVRASLKESSDLLAGNTTIMEIRERSREWRAYGSPEARLRKTLATWGGVCEESIAALKKNEAVWSATLASTRSFEELEAVRTRVRRSLTDIEALETVAEERLRIIVELQGRVSKQATAIAEMVEKLAEATQTFKKRLFQPDAPPIWKAWSPGGERESFGSIFRRAVGRSYSNSTGFVESREGLVVETVLFVALAFAGIRWLGGAVSKAKSADPRMLQASRILDRRVALTVLMTAPLVLVSLPVRITVVLLILDVYLLPVVRLLPLITAWDRRMAALLALFYGLHAGLWILDGDHSAGRELSAALFAVTLIALAWWGRPLAMRRRKPADARRPETLRLRLSIAPLALILAANVFGFLLLSNLLRVAFILSTYIGLIIYMLTQALTTLTAAAVRVQPLCSLATIRLHEAAVVRWTRRAFIIVAGAWWVYLVLDLLTFRADVFNGLAALLNARIGIKSFSLSLGNLLASICVLAGGYLLARGIRFVFREEILARLRLSRGVPDMISTSLYYVSLLLVFLMSLAAAGVQLDKLTVLTGAFGVGVGFGMQNVISNFVSGLVLQFERPIRIGDVLEVGNLAGEVQRIGIRSSLVRTFQGAEVIVPNSNLVSNQVVNWTLSEPVRRVDLQVPVAYGTAPERVIELLLGVVRGHPEVRRDPEPGAFFMAFGPCSLDFLLMFWAEQQTHFRLRSEVAIAVNAALNRAGIEIPLPQREIRMRTSESLGLPEAASARTA
jgi:potassium efflux system protein